MLGTGEITASVRQKRTEELRELMLAEMGDSDYTDFPEVARRVRYATDAQGLWYARGDVMQVLKAVHGSSIARRKMRRISGGFKGLLPSGMNPRRSSLRF